MFGGFAGFGGKSAISNNTVIAKEEQQQPQQQSVSTSRPAAMFGNNLFVGFNSQMGSSSLQNTQSEKSLNLDDDFNAPDPVRGQTDNLFSRSLFDSTSTYGEASRDEPRRKRGFIMPDNESAHLSLFNNVKSNTRSGNKQPINSASDIPPERRKLRESRRRMPWPSGPIEVKRLENVQKDFYCQTQSTSTMDKMEIQTYLNAHNITFHGEYEPILFLQFSDLDSHFSNVMYDSQFKSNSNNYYMSSVLKEKYNFSNPTYIQSASWPIVLQGRDCIGIAETGSGKTFAFAIPALLHAASQPLTSEAVPSPIVIVLAPARELVLQIYTEIESLLSHFNSILYSIYGDKISYNDKKTTPLRPLYAAVSYGGKNWKEHYVKLIAEPLDILVTTPGIFAYFYNRNYLNLSRTTYVVLDECDAMLSSGFKTEISILLENSAPNRQTLLWSATWPSEVAEIAQSHLNENTVFLGIGNYRASVNKRVIQHIVVAKSIQQKNVYLVDLLKCIMDGTFDESMEKLQGHAVFTSIATSIQDEYHTWCSSLKQQSEARLQNPNQKLVPAKVIIFTNRKVSASEIHNELSNIYDGRSYVIHGDIPQCDREKALEKFKSNEGSILVATDAVARGIHIEGVTHVINYDIPNDHVSYVHRCGRTGRAGKFGHAISIFLTRKDRCTVDALAGYFKENNESAVLPPEFLDSNADEDRGENGFSRRAPRRVEEDFQSHSKDHFTDNNDDPFDG